MRRVEVGCDGCGRAEETSDGQEVNVFLPPGWFRYEGVTMRPGLPAKTLRGELCSLDCLVAYVKAKTTLPE